MPLITEDTPFGTHIKLIGNHDSYDEDYKECINQAHGYTGAWISVPLDVTNTFDKDDENFDDV